MDKEYRIRNSTIVDYRIVQTSIDPRTAYSTYRIEEMIQEKLNQTNSIHSAQNTLFKHQETIVH